MERICPAPDVFATCPSDGKILEYYKDTFEAVYVLLQARQKLRDLIARETRNIAPARSP
jgi:hypothetical protein